MFSLNSLHLTAVGPAAFEQQDILPCEVNQPAVHLFKFMTGLLDFISPLAQRNEVKFDLREIEDLAKRMDCVIEITADGFSAPLEIARATHRNGRLTLAVRAVNGQHARTNDPAPVNRLCGSFLDEEKT